MTTSFEIPRKPVLKVYKSGNIKVIDKWDNAHWFVTLEMAKKFLNDLTSTSKQGE